MAFAGANLTASDQNSSRIQRPRLRIIAGADDFGCSLKDALIAHLRSIPSVEVNDLGTESYYSIAAAVGHRISQHSAENTDGSMETRGLLACGTGVGVGIFANKFPGVYAATCTTVAEAVDARSISGSNVLAVSGMRTAPTDAVEILDAWLKTPFKAPCPASGDKPWADDISGFLDKSVTEMAKIGAVPALTSRVGDCAICCLRKEMEFEPVGIMPGGMMKILRQSPTSAIVKFKAGSVEPAHHHTFGHDVVVRSGRKKVWNLSKGTSYELEEGDYLFTPAGDLHRVKYFEDTEFFIGWGGDWDIFLDEDLDAAAAAIDEALSQSR